MKTKRLTPPLGEREIQNLRAGELVSITGEIVTARDKAYARVVSGAKLPVKLKGGVVYHCGPIAKRMSDGWHIISSGPTTSARLDQLQVEFVRRTGVKALVGKGGVGEDVASQLARLGCVYLAFTGGAGVLAAKTIEKVEKVFWEELGPAEALWVLKVKEFGPLVVAVDTHGGNLYIR